MVSTRRVTVTHPVTPELWADFVRMTPLMQDASAEKKRQVAEDAEEKVTVDLYVTAARVRGQRP